MLAAAGEDGAGKRGQRVRPQDHPAAVAARRGGRAERGVAVDRHGRCRRLRSAAADQDLAAAGIPGRVDHRRSELDILAGDLDGAEDDRRPAGVEAREMLQLAKLNPPVILQLAKSDPQLAKSDPQLAKSDPQLAKLNPPVILQLAKLNPPVILQLAKLNPHPVILQPAKLNPHPVILQLAKVGLRPIPRKQISAPALV